jgi:hypothetical protein
VPVLTTSSLRGILEGLVAAIAIRGVIASSFRDS